jgi:hypothetical protein
VVWQQIENTSIKIMMEDISIKSVVNLEFQILFSLNLCSCFSIIKAYVGVVIVVVTTTLAIIALCVIRAFSKNMLAILLWSGLASELRCIIH